MDFYTDPLVDALQVPLAVQTNTAPRVTIHWLDVPTRTGDKVLVTAQFEVTNPNPYAVGIGRLIQRSDGALIIPAAMDNVTPQMHHSVITMAGWDAAPIPNATYSVVVYAVSTAAISGHAVRIEQGYGFLQAMRFSP